MRENYDAGLENDGDDSPIPKRPRAKHACEPCRSRKRGCDGAVPCHVCKQLRDRCYYENHQRKRSKVAKKKESQASSKELAESEPERAREDQVTLEEMLSLRYMEANSSVNFSRILGQRIDPSSGPGPDQEVRIGYNLGVPEQRLSPVTTPITDFLTEAKMHSMATAYFETVHVVTGFLDQAHIFQQIHLRWAQPELSQIPDHLLGHLAIVGSGFSNGAIGLVRQEIAAAAERELASTSMMLPPSLIDAQSWLLRSVYLRAHGHPHAAHTASSMTMHIIESIGLHQEPSPKAAEDPEVVENGRRTFWLARVLNTFVSFELGRTRVHLHGITVRYPTPRQGDYILSYIQLYNISSFLNPDRTEIDWEESLRRLEEFEAPHDAISMSHANISLVAYRRFRLANPIHSSEMTSRFIKLCLMGLEAARRAV